MFRDDEHHDKEHQTSRSQEEHEREELVTLNLYRLSGSNGEKKQVVNALSLGYIFLREFRPGAGTRLLVLMFEDSG